MSSLITKIHPILQIQTFHSSKFIICEYPLQQFFHLVETYHPLTKSVSAFLTHLFTLHKFHGSSSYNLIAHILTSLAKQPWLYCQWSIAASTPLWYLCNWTYWKKNKNYAEWASFIFILSNLKWVFVLPGDFFFPSACTLPLSTSYQQTVLLVTLLKQYSKILYPHHFLRKN